MATIPTATTNTTFLLNEPFASSGRVVHCPNEYRELTNNPDIRRAFRNLVLGHRLRSRQLENQQTYRHIEIKKGFLVFGCVLAFTVAIVAAIMIPFVAITWFAIALGIGVLASLVTGAVLIRPTERAFQIQPRNSRSATEVTPIDIDTVTDTLRGYLDIENRQTPFRVHPFDYFNQQANLEAHYQENNNIPLQTRNIFEVQRD
ncbi:MAG: hypothetical protein S4CHLAM20_05260 [Chlamydiia bacterium]|nr:hypothetical protein [Chlamydiia bacterium]